MQRMRKLSYLFVLANLFACVSTLLFACGKDGRDSALRALTEDAPAAGMGCTEDRDNDGYGPGCKLGADCDDGNPAITYQCRACLRNEPGCACAAEGKRIPCGKVVSRSGDTVTCSLGGQICLDGKWSECLAGAYAPGHDGYITTKGLGQAGTAGSCEDCDPHCHLMLDTPDGLGDGGGGGPYIDDAGTLRYPTTENPVEPTPADLAALAIDGGRDGGIVKVLVPGQTSDPSDPVIVKDDRPAGADVYFLIDDTSSMGPVANALRDSIAASSGKPCETIYDGDGGIIAKKAPAGAGIVENLKCSFGDDVSIGMGRYEDYSDYRGQVPSVVSGGGYPYADPSVPYQHILSVQLDVSPPQRAASFVVDTAYEGGVSRRGGGDVPESLTSALYAAATGFALTRGATPDWNVPRVNWITPWPNDPTSISKYGAHEAAGGCPQGRTGYPCWRPRTTPLFIVMTDAPSHNGPGGQYAYPQYGASWTTGAAASPRTNASPNSGNNPPVSKTFSQANELEYETSPSGVAVGLKPRLYWGTVTRNVTSTNPLQEWPSNSSVGVGEQSVSQIAGRWYGRNSLRDCAATATVTITPPAASPAEAFGNFQIPWPEAGYKRDSQVKPEWCEEATYVEQPYVTAPGVSQSAAATYGAALSPLTCSGNGVFSGSTATCEYLSTRIQLANTNLKMDGVTGGSESFLVNTAGSKVSFSIRMIDDAQIANAQATLNVAISGSSYSRTVVGENSVQTIDVYPTASDQSVVFSVRSPTANPVVAITYRVTPPSMPACSGGTLRFRTDSPVQCLRCAAGYTAKNGACFGADIPSCNPGKLFAAESLNGCPASNNTPDAARTRQNASSADSNYERYVVGGCFSCPTDPNVYAPTYEAGSPRVVSARGGTKQTAPGCYIPSCTTPFSWPPGATTTAGGAEWRFDQGGSLATNGSGRCVLDESQLTCGNGPAPICANYKHLCNNTKDGSWSVDSLNPKTVTSLCGCTRLNGAALMSERPAFPATAPPAGFTGLIVNYFRRGIGIGGLGGFGITDSTAARYESGPSFATVSDPTNAPWTTGLAVTDNFQARGTGTLTLPGGCGGDWEFTMGGDDWGRLWVDGKLVVDARQTINADNNTFYNFGRTWQLTPLPRFSLVPNRAYPIKFEMIQFTHTRSATPMLRRVSGTGQCSAGLVSFSAGMVFTAIPSAWLTPDYVSPMVPDSAQCLTHQTYGEQPSTTTTLGDGSMNAESIYKFTVPAGQTFHYHFALIRGDAPIGASTGSLVNETSVASFLYLKRESEISKANGRVVDCNKVTTPFSLSSTNVLSEINGQVGAGTYYLVVDNHATTVQTSYNYVLQVGQFEESLTLANKIPTAPTYKEMIRKLQAMDARVIGVDSSGVSCGEANVANISQFETRDQLLKLGLDTGSVNATGQPIVVSLTSKAGTCPRDPDTGTPVTTLETPPASLTSKINEAVTTLAKTFRRDLVIRATKVGANASPYIDPSNAAFAAEDFMAEVTADASSSGGKCGNPPINPGLPPVGPDFDPSFVAPSTRQMFNACLPGAQVRFNVKFRVPTTVQRTNLRQYFSFDLVVSPVARDENGNRVPGAELARIPVTIVVPEIDAGSTSLVRDYDSDAVCIRGTRPVWSGFGYNSLAPDNIVGKDSKIEFFFSTADNRAGLAAPGSSAETLFATSTRIDVSPDCATAQSPRSEVCNRLDLKQALIRAGQLPNRRWVRVRVKLSPSSDFSRVPTLINWKMHLSCVPSE
jgi:hypothetical protein